MSDIEVQRAVCELVLALRRVITASREIDRVLQCLDCGVHWLLEENMDHVLENGGDDFGADIRGAHQALQQLVCRIQPPPSSIRTTFYHSCFLDFAESLFSVVAVDWLPRFPIDKTSLFHRWFTEAHPVFLLKALTNHLSTVQPLSRKSRMMVLPASADVAAQYFIERFMYVEDNGTRIEKQGITDVVKSATKNEKNASDAEELASMLTAIPDITAGLHKTQPLLRPESYVPYLLHQLLCSLRQDDDCDDFDARAINFAAEVVGRLAGRGHAQLVATVLARQAIDSASIHVIAGILEDIPQHMHLERLFEYLLVAFSTSPKPATLGQLLTPSIWINRADLRLTFTERLFIQRTLPSMSALRLLVEYLDTDHHSSTNDLLALTTTRIAMTWGDKAFIQRASAKQQAYTTAALIHCMHSLSKDRFERSDPRLLGAILTGVGNRLESPLPAVQRQGMRVGRAMSQVLDPDNDNEKGKVLFDDQDVDVLPEERWEVEQTRMEKKKKKIQGRKRLGNTRTKSNEEHVSNEYPLTETDSDDEEAALEDVDHDGVSSSSDSEFERFDLDESDEEQDAKNSNVQLRDLITSLQNAEKDWKGQLQAIKTAQHLIRAAPDELPIYAVSLARALLHTRVPQWADEEKRPGDESFETQRFKSLVAITVQQPEQVGLSIAEAVYSPSMDVEGRVRALGVLAATAGEISHPGSILNLDDTITSTALSTDSKGEGKRAGRVMRQSNRLGGSLKNTIQKENRFPPIALQWASSLLKECDVKKHGIDLFGRDGFVLGRLLVTLGSFLEASQRTPEAIPLSAAVLELIKGSGVYDNDEPYVRRAALMAASQALAAIPAPAIAGVMLGNDTSAGAPSALAERLQWLQGWVQNTVETDSDENCRHMAKACRGLQQALASEALKQVAADVDARNEEFYLPGSDVPLKISLPSIETLSIRGGSNRGVSLLP